ncbi:hypothetical protein BegalDRAFT_0749 [Beggiatoa alba B18LD]|uniref:J domain-containing protein n=1 Tax=Beggiatoa alba B18LD TaxID=395493 RepID=I3CDG8_9GAMM|nr:hypothetical protein [Beggiatoa alba]EIJ41661.1 hypothetical protein BegalDRAFT_0749 [Beggiatoa alba B18LD]
MIKNYYQILKVPRDASPDQIKRAAQSKAAEITEAYNILKDPKQRDLHDATLDEFDRRVRFIKQRNHLIYALIPLIGYFLMAVFIYYVPLELLHHIAETSVKEGTTINLIDKMTAILESYIPFIAVLLVAIGGLVAIWRFIWIRGEDPLP